jgi:hypothetical protein
LLRSTARGAVSLERLAQDATGHLVSPFTHPWSDGTTGITRSPLALLEKLAALMALPRIHLVRYGGYLAPHSHLRGVIIPTLRQQGMEAVSPAVELPVTACCQQGWLGASAPVRVIRGSAGATGGGWEALGDVKSGFIFPILVHGPLVRVRWAEALLGDGA